MKTFEEISRLVTKYPLMIDECQSRLWIDTYSAYMRAELIYQRCANLVIQPDNPYWLQKLEVERDYLKRQVELIEKKLGGHHDIVELQ
jgi:hypothetical protein